MIRLFFLSLMFFLPVLSLSAADLPTEAQDIVQQHLGAIKTLDSLTCDVAFYQTEPVEPSGPKQLWAARYHRHQNTVRSIYQEAGITRDNLYQDGVLYSIRSQPNSKNREMSKHTRKSSYSPRYDAYTEMMFALNIPATIQYAPLDEIIRLSTKCQYRSTEPDSPHLLLTFNNNDARSTLDLQFSKRHKYLIEKATYVITLDAGITRRVNQIQHFQEMAPGLYVPSIITLNSELNGNSDGAFKTIVSNIVCNKYDPKNFTQRLSDNMHVVDVVAGSTYKIDATGKKTTLDKKLIHHGKSKLTGATPNADNSHTGDTVSENARPAKSGFGPWTITAVIGAIGAGVCIWYYRTKPIKK